jgi:hypothetical protein
MKKFNYFIVTLAVAGTLFYACKKKTTDDTPAPTTGGGADSTILVTDFDHHGLFAACYTFGSTTTSDSARNPAVATPLAHSGTGFWKLSGTCAPNAYYLDGFGGTDGAALNLDMNDSIAFWVNTEANSASYVQLQVLDLETKPASTQGSDNTSCPAINGEGFVYKIVLPATNGWVRKSVCIASLTSDPYQVNGDDPSTLSVPLHPCWAQLDHVFTPNVGSCQKIGFTTGDAGSGVPVEVNIDDISIIKVPN